MAQRASAQTSWTPVLELKIGAVDGPNALSNVIDVAVTRSGQLFVALPQEHTVAVFGPDGTRLRDIGGRGEGPGEFQYVLRIGVYNDELWAADTRLRRLSFFDTTGTYLRSVTWRSEYLPARPLADGSFAAFVQSQGGPPPNMGERSFTADGAVRDTIAELPGDHTPLTIGRAVVPNPLSAHALLAYSPDSRYLVHVDRSAVPDGEQGIFSVVWTDIVSRARQTRSFRYAPKRLSEAVIVALLGQLPPQLTAGGQARSEVERYRYIPPISDIVVGTDHSAWIARERLGQTSVRWYRVTRAGELEGYVVLPPSTRIVAADGTRFWALSREAFDVQYISRYRYR